MKQIKIIIGALSLFFIGSITLLNFIFCSHGTDLVFVSSDGKWFDREVQFKGRNFETVVYFFEVYKIECNTKNVKLERLETENEWYSFSSLFDKSTDIKWKVPLSSNATHAISGLPLQHFEPSNCYRNSITKQQESAARLAAKEYLESLQ